MSRLLVILLLALASVTLGGVRMGVTGGSACCAAEAEATACGGSCCGGGDVEPSPGCCCCGESVAPGDGHLCLLVLTGGQALDASGCRQCSCRTTIVSPLAFMIGLGTRAPMSPAEFALLSTPRVASAMDSVRVVAHSREATALLPSACDGRHRRLRSCSLLI